MSSSEKIRPVIIDNRRKGNLGESIVKKIYKDRGYKILSKNHGCDFIAIGNISSTTKSYREYVEVKTGLSRQTKRQKITMKKAIRNGDNYTICYISDAFLKKFIFSNGGLLE